MVMRPYQITATERILNRIEIANNYKKYGSIAGGGYIWHTTGSGKTLTSFKTARLASLLPYIDKVLFVVDRKDLDYQTMNKNKRFCSKTFTAFVVGATIGDIDTERKVDSGAIHIVTYGQLVETASQKLFRLRERLEKHYADIGCKSLVERALEDHRQLSIKKMP